MNTKNQYYASNFPDNRSDYDTPLRQAQMVMLRMLKIVDDICQRHGIEYWLDGGTLLGAVRHKGFIPWDDDIDIAMMRDDYDRFVEIVESELSDDLFFQTPENDPGFMNMITPVKIRDLKSLIFEGYENGSEPYHQGLFVDIFPYDHLPSDGRKRKFYKYLGKKLLKVKRAKLEKHRKHHGHLLNSFYGKLLSVEAINRLLRSLIDRVNGKNADVIGFGLDSTLTRYYGKEKFFPLQRIEFEGNSFSAPKDTDYYLRVTYGDYMELPPKEEQVPKHLSKLIPLLKDADE